MKIAISEKEFQILHKPTINEHKIQKRTLSNNLKDSCNINCRNKDNQCSSIKPSINVDTERKA